MGRSLIHLRRALFGTSCVIVFGFGATQALASPVPATSGSCTEKQEQACYHTCLNTFGPMATSSCVDAGPTWYLCECGIQVDETQG